MEGTCAEEDGDISIVDGGGITELDPAGDGLVVGTSGFADEWLLSSTASARPEPGDRAQLALGFPQTISLPSEAALTGHASLKEVERYTKDAARKIMAQAAMAKVRTSSVKPTERFDKTRKKA